MKLETKPSIPTVYQLPADLETPVTVFLKVARKAPSFLLESVEKGEHLGRYSFLGTEPDMVVKVQDDSAQILYQGKEREVALSPSFDPLHLLKSLLAHFPVASDPSLPRFFGGFIGYLGYEFARFLEKLPPCIKDEPDIPHALFILAREIIIFDHLKHKIILVSCQQNDKEAKRKIEGLLRLIEAPVPRQSPVAKIPLKPQANFTKEEFERMVLKAKEYIFSGDIFQVVLSQKLRCWVSAHPLDIYRALRMINPSPYMFYLDFGDFQLIGSSPEMLVRLEGKKAETRPIAGTRPRKDPREDEAISCELLSDPKERAEHIMLVDLGRNDLGRVCRFGTVKVEDFMSLEKYSHVIHIVSSVKGELNPGEDAFSLLRACFPAGTVTGAPKVRAMEIIAELEKIQRGAYAGAVGYFGFSGNMDTAIAIRTIIKKGEFAYLQGGAGIVADSIPEREYEESLKKMEALLWALNPPFYA